MKKDNFIMNVTKFFETLGVDLFPYAIGLSKFESNTLFEPTKLQEIRQKVQDLDVEKLDDALKFSKELLDAKCAPRRKN